MTLNFTVKEEDYLVLYRYIRKQKLKKQSLLSRIAPPLILGWFAVLYYYSEDWLLFFLMSGLAVFFLIFDSFFKKKWDKNKIKNQVAVFYSKMYNSEINLELTEQTLIERSKIAENKIFLSAVTKIVESKSYCFIWIENGHIIMIPMRDVNDFEFNAFIEMINEKTTL